MKALSLFCVLALAKVLAVVGREVPLTMWSPLALFWQDALVALVFAGVDALLRKRPGWSWLIYGAIVLYVAVNLPLVRLLSSAMTVTMFRAAGGALSDSIRHHLTAANVGLIAAVLVSAVAIPLALRSCAWVRTWRVRLAVAVAGVAMVAIGPAATRCADTSGLHRNALVTLAASALPRDSSRSVSDLNEDWRRSPFPSIARAEDLTWLRGAGAGRNVVLISLESTGAQYLGLHGAGRDPMPNLSALAKEALVFENAYAVYPESIKGLFSILCSEYPAVHTKPEEYRKLGRSALPRALKAAGYRTAMFHSGRFDYLGMREIIEGRGFDVLEDAGDIGGNRRSSFGVDEDATVARMLGFIDALPAGEKFFLTYLPIAGHHPYDAPQQGPFPSNTEQDCYLNALWCGDAALGRFIHGLRERGLYDKTVFVVFGDHGEAFGQHEGNYGHTLFIWEENVRVPFLVAIPGVIRSPLRSMRIVSLIDTAPTILDVLGVQRPGGFQGKSLVETDPGMALFFTDYSLELLGLRDGPWKFILEMDTYRPRLFHLAVDPPERHDLASLHADRAGKYAKLLQNWSATQRHRVTSPGEGTSLSQAATEP